VGFTIGSGLSFPSGDLADDGKYGADTGKRFALGIDVFPVEALSVGVFVQVDGYSVDEISLGQLTLPEESIITRHGSSIKVKDVTAGEVGGSLKYYFRPKSTVQPYGEMWMGISSLSISTEQGGASSDEAFGFGLGGGVLYQPFTHFGLSAGLLYNHTKTGEVESESTSRIDVVFALNILL
jgi:opacity protein-like surface antigen